MPIPDFQSLMRPLLTRLQDSQPHKFGDLVPLVARDLQLTNDELEVLLPSGRQGMFRNRLHWASFYMLKAGLLERPKKGWLRITARGTEALQSAETIDLVTMRYGGSRKDAGRAVGRSGDGGIDGIIKEDRLGLDAVYVQAKRWEASVGRPVVQAFAGSLEGHRSRKGVLITTSDFSSEARDYVDRIEKRIVLIGGKDLADLMIEHGIGVTIVQNYTLKRLDSDYFDEEE